MKNRRCCFCGCSKERTGRGFVLSKNTDEAICDLCITDIVIFIHGERGLAEKLENLRDEDTSKS
ncbi:hypothetical protein FXR45_22375 [Salmonella enterica]|nr:hypothetical protein [Salmonella enterica]ECP0727368.1 hypothetical protein [Salmonella enterica]EDB2180575.1 hypothetical protein [Salmonella enterica]EDC3737202.1 hypothetical protein [Salmonella enterica]EEC5375140.1 hypothetical protein [Salmonella enterica]